jgi:hypothetical protein
MLGSRSEQRRSRASSAVPFISFCFHATTSFIPHLYVPFPQAIKVVSRHNPRADRLNQLKRKRIPRSGPHLPVTDNLGSQEYKIKKEIAVMKLCRHPHVVRLLEVIDDKLYQKVYMGQFVSILLLHPSPFCRHSHSLCWLLGCTMRLYRLIPFTRSLTLSQ